MIPQRQGHITWKKKYLFQPKTFGNLQANTGCQFMRDGSVQKKKKAQKKPHQICKTTKKINITEQSEFPDVEIHLW